MKEQMRENNEMRKVFEDRQKDIYQGSEELSSYPDGKYLSHYVRCDFDWFQAAWEHQQIKIKELESQLEQAALSAVPAQEPIQCKDCYSVGTTCVSCCLSQQPAQKSVKQDSN